MSTDAENIIELYRRHAQAWTKARSHALPDRKWLDKFIHLLPKAARVLDVGCGFGTPNARHLLERGIKVRGIDTSPELIATAKQTLPEGVWDIADMRTLALGQTFDGVLAWDSFFHLHHADQRAMFPIFAAHCADGAALMFTSGPHHGEAIGSFQGEPLYHASLDPEEYRALLAAHEFEVIDHIAEDPDSGGHSVWLARRTARGP